MYVQQQLTEHNVLTFFCLFHTNVAVNMVSLHHFAALDSDDLMKMCIISNTCFESIQNIHNMYNISRMNIKKQTKQCCIWTYIRYDSVG